MAQGWTNLAPMARLHRARLTRDLLIIPDGDPTGVEHVFTFDGEFRVEQARLKVDITHPARGELQVELVSPSGTVSRLWSPHSDSNDDLRHRFLSVFHWGEPAAGEWKVRLVDFVPEQSGYLSGLELELFGTSPDPEVRLALERAVSGGWELRLTGRPEATGILQRSEDLKGWTDVSAISLPEGTAVVMLPEVMHGASWYRWVEKRD
jgi:proprotein convertase subtilisin/kexin type 6